MDAPNYFGRGLTFSLSILSLLAAIRLVTISDSLTEWDVLLPMIAFLMSGILLGVVTWLYNGQLGKRYQFLLGKLGGHLGLHLLWLLIVLAGWFLLTQFAPVLVIDLFPVLVLMSINALLLIGVHGWASFAPLAKLYGGVGFGLLLAIGLLEIGLRLYQFPEDNPIGAQLSLFDAYISDPNIGHALKPNADFTWTNAEQEFTVDVHINDLGLRDVERRYEREADVPRILVLGDSFTEALQVSLDESPTQVMEKCLLDHYEQPIEVVNGGLSANGTGQRLRYYQQYGHQFAADVVIHTHYPSNDLWDNGGALGDFPSWRGIYSFGVNGNDELVTMYSEPSRNLMGYFADDWGSRIFAVLRAIDFNRQQQNLARVNFFDTALYSADFPDNLPQVWRTHQLLMRDFQDEVEADDAVFGLAMIPNWRVVQPDGDNNLPDGVNASQLDFDAMHEAIRADAESVGIPVLDLKFAADEYYAEDDAASLYWEFDAHFNDLGYHG